MNKLLKYLAKTKRLKLNTYSNMCTWFWSDNEVGVTSKNEAWKLVHLWSTSQWLRCQRPSIFCCLSQGSIRMWMETLGLSVAWWSMKHFVPRVLFPVSGVLASKQPPGVLTAMKGVCVCLLWWGGGGWLHVFLLLPLLKESSQSPE